MCEVTVETARNLLDEAVENGRLDRRETTAGAPVFEAPERVGAPSS